MFELSDNKTRSETVVGNTKPIKTRPEVYSSATLKLE